ncbi:MAG: OadG family protein [Rikenellaceae bacterium]|nr:OadG family protein [Rikenellaceae bacterium]
MSTINTALMLLAVGMGTVFIILLLIIYFSRGLIKLVNKFAPDETLKSAPSVAISGSNDAIPPKIIAAITAAVSMASKGRSKIVKIEKLK